MSGPAGEPQRIAEITLDERTVIRRSRAIEDERAAAITDLLKSNQFTPLSGRTGPFHLHLAIEENRLVMAIRAAADGSSESIVLPLAPFRRIVKDYFLVCESYYEAIRDKSLSQVEAIEVGRRADWLVLDAAHPSLAGAAADTALDHLLFASAEAAIRDVAVAGRWVIKERRHAVDDDLRPRFAGLMQRLAT